jgi:hypothetical protein
MGDQIKENEMNGEGRNAGDMRNAYKILVVKPKGKRPLGRLDYMGGYY